MGKEVRIGTSKRFKGSRAPGSTGGIETISLTRIVWLRRERQFDATGPETRVSYVAPRRTTAGLVATLVAVRGRSAKKHTRKRSWFNAAGLHRHPLTRIFGAAWGAKIAKSPHSAPNAARTPSARVASSTRRARCTRWPMVRTYNAKSLGKIPCAGGQPRLSALLVVNGE